MDFFGFQELFLKEDDLFLCPGKVIYRLDRGGCLVTAVSNKLTSAQIVFDSLNTHGSKALGVRIWINKSWVAMGQCVRSRGKSS